MHVDPLMPYLSGLAFAVVAVGMVLRRFGQPLVLAYLVLGALVGPHAIGVFTDPDAMARFGATGVVLLLFFAGMEMSPVRLTTGWRVAFIGTGLQIAASVGCVAVVGTLLGWQWSRILLLGFVISLSSTALILRLLQDLGEDESEVGRNVTLILLAQDMAVVPMLIILGTFGAEESPFSTIALQVIGGSGLFALTVWLVRRGEIHLPLGALVQNDKELQVFAAMSICSGFAVLTGLLHLSAALGAFVAGMVVNAARETTWVEHSLKPFEVLFVAVFLLSVGMQLNPMFVWDHWLPLSLLVTLVLLTNTILNGLILRLLGSSWRDSLYAAALLSQVGEFSFVLALVGHTSGIISEFAYHFTISLIALSLVLTPAWARLVQRLTVRYGSPEAA